MICDVHDKVRVVVVVGVGIVIFSDVISKETVSLPRVDCIGILTARIFADLQHHDSNSWGETAISGY